MESDPSDGTDIVGQDYTTRNAATIIKSTIPDGHNIVSGGHL